MSHKKQKHQSQKSSATLHFNPFDWLVSIFAGTIFIIILVTGVINLASIPAADRPLEILILVANLVALFASTTYMILAAKGRRSNFIFSIFSVIACAIIAGASHFYGTAAINLLYYLPCDFIGFFLWGQNSRKNHEVVARKLTGHQFTVVIIITILASISIKTLLDSVGGVLTGLDSVATVIAIIANILVLLRYREQWLFWLATDALQLIMWTTTDNLAMLTLRILYPITAVYGYINWRKLVKSPRTKSPKAKSPKSKSPRK